VIIDAIVEGFCAVALFGNRSENTSHAAAPLEMNLSEKAIYQKINFRETGVS
jgi:hypothetical protein